jgi:16S rRNA C1402 N4-methylase RsmH
MEDIESLNSSLSPIVEAMKEKFLKYWEEVPAVIIIANYLYPSFKKKYTVNLLQRYKQKLRLHTNEEENRVNNLLEEMFNIYNYRRNANNPSSTSRNIIYAF